MRAWALNPLAAAAVFLGLGAGCAPKAERPRNAILVSIDTLRADRLGCYGYARPTSPALDSLAKDGSVFLNVSAQAPWTLPSHASLLTGRLPHRHGVVLHDAKLPQDVPTLAEILAGAGFETAAVVNSLWLGKKYGLSRGFQSLEQFTETANVGDQITDLAIRWLEERGSAPFFLFLHYYDLHSPYTPDARFAELFTEGNGGPDDGSHARLWAAFQGKSTLSPAEARHASNLYDAEIRQLDQEVGRLRQALDALALSDDTLVVVTSDHGEEFLEHGGVLHGRTLYQEMVRVPLVVAGPGLPRGRRVDALALSVDVVPTILAQLGLSPPPALDGRDLFAVADDAEAPARLGFARADWDYGETPDRWRMVRDGRFKLLVDRVDDSAQLYDLVRDPGEQTDLAAQRPEVVDALRAELPGLLSGARRADPSEPRTPEEEALLRQLGYAE